MLNWLADNVSVFKIQHNAHREFHLNVAQHLAHRARIGNAPMFVNARDSDLCASANLLWELRVVLHDGAICDIAGSTLDKCLHAAQGLILNRQTAVAA